jgi:putative effector of murein hydrolase
MANRVVLKTLGVAHPSAAGIDIGSASHFVAVRADADPKSVAPTDP